MRVIGGEFRSRVLVTPRGTATRPTSDRLRETLFNVLAPRLEGARFADLYAGAGAVGIEALSRGASVCLFVEQAPAALTAIRGNLAQLGLGPKAAVDPRGVARALADGAIGQERFDLVFLDPPYEATEEYAATLRALGGRASMLAPGAIVIAEHARRDPLPERAGALLQSRLLEQGDAALSFYRIEADTKPRSEGTHDD